MFPRSTLSLARYNRMINRNSAEKCAKPKRKLPFHNSLMVDSDAANIDMASAPPPLVEENMENTANQHNTCIKLLAEANIQAKQLVEEINRLTLENQELRTSDSKLRQSKLSEDRLKFYTGLPSKACFMWLLCVPEKEEIMMSRPQCFKDTFPKCVWIIDCTEVFIDAPSNFEARNSTYSTYKHANTIKYLVSITPSGAVSFVSQAYPGKTSDKVITNNCGYLEFIRPGDLVMADRGFLIVDELNELGADLVIPAFTKGKAQLSARDVEQGRKISNVRIHVARAMERLKNFRILADKMHSNLVPHADSVMIICAAIMNLHPCLVGDQQLE